MTNQAVIVSACRTPVGSFGGTLASLSAAQLGAVAIRQAIARANLEPDAIEDVIMGQLLTAGVGQNAARQAGMGAGIPKECPAMTINQACGSGLRAVHLLAQAIANGDIEVGVGGGQESMSTSPHVLLNSRQGFRMGDTKLKDTMILDALTDAFNNYHMGITAENLARQYNISRQEQDAFACASQNKAEQAQTDDKFVDEIIPVEVPVRKGDPIVFAADEYIKKGVTVDSLAKLRPAFDKEGTVTAGNASGINDGAAALVVMSAKRAQALNLTPLAVIEASASCGVDPSIMGIGPAPASKKCLSKAGWSVDQVDLFEINEAFAAQAMSVNKEMGWDTNKVNVNGGAIAIGHPVGASGARVLVTLLHEMKKQNAKKGLASLCIGGGMGIAMAVSAA